MNVNWFPLWLSLRVAAVATLVSVALGLWIAYFLAIRSFRGKELLDALVTLPLSRRALEHRVRPSRRSSGCGWRGRKVCWPRRIWRWRGSASVWGSISRRT